MTNHRKTNKAKETNNTNFFAHSKRKYCLMGEVVIIKNQDAKNTEFMMPGIQSCTALVLTSANYTILGHFDKYVHTYSQTKRMIEFLKDKGEDIQHMQAQLFGGDSKLNLIYSTARNYEAIYKALNEYNVKYEHKHYTLITCLGSSYDLIVKPGNNNITIYKNSTIAFLEKKLYAIVDKENDAEYFRRADERLKLNPERNEHYKRMKYSVSIYRP